MNELRFELYKKTIIHSISKTNNLQQLFKTLLSIFEIINNLLKEDNINIENLMREKLQEDREMLEKEEKEFEFM